MPAVYLRWDETVGRLPRDRLSYTVRYIMPFLTHVELKGRNDFLALANSASQAGLFTALRVGKIPSPGGDMAA